MVIHLGEQILKGLGVGFADVATLQLLFRARAQVLFCRPLRTTTLLLGTGSLGTLTTACWCLLLLRSGIFLLFWFFLCWWIVTTADCRLLASWSLLWCLRTRSSWRLLLFFLLLLAVVLLFGLFFRFRLALGTTWLCTLAWLLSTLWCPSRTWCWRRFWLLLLLLFLLRLHFLLRLGPSGTACRGRTTYRGGPCARSLSWLWCRLLLFLLGRFFFLRFGLCRASGPLRGRSTSLRNRRLAMLPARLRRRSRSSSRNSRRCVSSSPVSRQMQQLR
uniref:Uncharacterized protein n=1 Tax=Anopheles merus TaxID=30066 RepID=A0A182UY85_ANOME